VHAQQEITASGADASGNGGSVSYSIGQVAYISTGINTLVSEGVQQAYRVPFIIIAGIKLVLSIYPNPTTDLLYLEAHNTDHAGLRYLLYDLNGKLLESKKAGINSTSISMGRFTTGTYILRVLQNNEQIKSFKIIKNK
jgi:hypothetical protein